MHTWWDCHRPQSHTLTHKPYFLPPHRLSTPHHPQQVQEPAAACLPIPPPTPPPPALRQPPCRASTHEQQRNASLAANMQRTCPDASAPAGYNVSDVKRPLPDASALAGYNISGVITCAPPLPLQGLGISDAYLAARVLCIFPSVLGCDVGGQLRPVIGWLMSLGLEVRPRRVVGVGVGGGGGQGASWWCGVCCMGVMRRL